MSFWTDNDQRNGFDDAEDLSYPPDGSPVRMWLMGVGLALVPIAYGVYCLLTRHAVLPGDQDDMDLYGSKAVSMAYACIAIGLFIHAHWFWGMLPKFEVVSYILKFVAVLSFLGCLGYTVWKIASQ